jgi:hypothetical protein
MTKKSREPRDPTDMTHPFYDPAEDPTHPFYEGKTEAGQSPDPSDEDTYKVGPGFPPNEHKWKKGCPSPFPKGRPRKIPSMKPDLKKALETALNEKVVITKDKKEVVMTSCSSINSARATATPAATCFSMPPSWALTCRPRMSSPRRLGSTSRRSSMPPSCDASSSYRRSQRQTTTSRRRPTWLMTTSLNQSQTQRRRPRLNRIRRQRSRLNRSSTSTAKSSPSAT